jgi:hypothetical protein
MNQNKAEQPSTPDDGFFKRVSGLALNELAQALPDQAARAAALLGLLPLERGPIRRLGGSFYSEVPVADDDRRRTMRRGL